MTGPRLNTVQDHKTKIVYGQDNRLNICVRQAQPLLEAKLKTPDTLYSGNNNYKCNLFILYSIRINKSIVCACQEKVFT